MQPLRTDCARRCTLLHDTPRGSRAASFLGGFIMTRSKSIALAFITAEFAAPAASAVTGTIPSS
jgi:hypothetical protein